MIIMFVQFISFVLSELDFKQQILYQQ